MSDQATVVAPTPENTNISDPALEQAAPAKETPQAEGPQRKPHGRREAFKAMQERLGQEAAAVATETPAPGQAQQDALGNLHGPDGKFVEKSASTPDADPKPETSPQGSSPENAEVAATPDGVPAGHVRIPIPDELQRHFGREKVVPEAEADFFRFTLNEHTKRRQEADSLREENLRLKAEQEIRSKLFAGPEYSAALAKIEAVRTVDPEAAALMERGLEREIAEKTDTRYGEISKEQQVTAISDDANRIEQEAAEIIRQQFPQEWLYMPAAKRVWQDATDTCIARYQRVILRGEVPVFDPQDVVTEFRKQAVHDPWMRNYLTTRMQAEQQKASEAERHRIAAEEQEAARKREAETLLNTARKRDTMHPMGRIASQVRTDRQSVNTEGPTVRDAPPHQRRQLARERAIQRSGGV